MVFAVVDDVAGVGNEADKFGAQCVEIERKLFIASKEDLLVHGV